MRWFGEPWPTTEQRAPICSDDEQRMEVPIGQRCAYCDRLISKKSRGVSMPRLPIRFGITPEDEVAHLDCLRRAAFGAMEYNPDEVPSD